MLEICCFHNNLRGFVVFIKVPVIIFIRFAEINVLGQMWVEI